MENSNSNLTINFWFLAVIFTIILGGSSLGFLFLTRANSLVGDKIAAEKEAKRPSNLEAIIIKDKNCLDCFDVAPLLANLEKVNVKLTSTRSIDMAEEEAKGLIAKYSLEKLPTVILRGELQRNADLKNILSQGGDVTDDTFILRKIGGPYVAPATGEVKGRIELTLIGDATCSNCYDVRQHQAILSQFGLNPEAKSLDVSMPEAKTLMKKYQISLVPTFVLTGQVSEYPTLTNIWPQVGVVKDKAYVFTTGVSSMGVYKDLKTGKIVDPLAAQKPSASSSRP